MASIFLQACSPHSHTAELSTIEVAYNLLYETQLQALKSDPPTASLARIVQSRYDALFEATRSRSAVASKESHDIDIMFRASNIAQFYTRNLTDVADMEVTFSELRRRGIVTQFDASTMYDAYIANRLFAKARTFLREYPQSSRDALPSYSDETDGIGAGRTVILVKSNGSQLERHYAKISRNAQVIIVSSPFCHFSQHAIRDVERNAVLRRAFQSNALWLLPPDETEDFAEVARWNRAYPLEHMALAYRRSEWPMFDRWETPTFYFMKQGRVVSQVVGWPTAGRVQDLTRGLRLIGLQP